MPSSAASDCGRIQLHPAEIPRTPMGSPPNARPLRRSAQNDPLKTNLPPLEPHSNESLGRCFTGEQPQSQVLPANSELCQRFLIMIFRLKRSAGGTMVAS